MDSNQKYIDMYNQMTQMGFYYDSGRPVVIDPQIILDDVLSKLPVTKNDVILDVGCGTGTITIPLAKHCQFICALDAGAKVIEKAKLRCQQENVTNIAYYLGSALKLPFGQNSFDHVLMFGVIHAFENEEEAKQSVCQLVRVCKPGGRILIADIPDTLVRQEFEQRQKTPEEMRLINEFNANRLEYDRQHKEHVHKDPSITNLVLDCADIVAYGEKLGCQGSIVRQDIRQPMSLTRRDVVLIKNK